jgi:hypothetical protein
VKPNERGRCDIALARPETRACRNAVPAILVDRVFHCPVVVLIQFSSQGTFGHLCSSAKSSKNIKSTIKVCGLEMAVAWSSRNDQGRTTSARDK